MKTLRVAWRALALPGNESKQVFVAGMALASAKLAIRFLPFAKAVEFGSIPLAKAARENAQIIDEWARAVRRAGYSVPWRSVCFDQGLALQRLLRRRGVPALLCYGGSQGGSHLKAHVWVKVGDRVVIGEEEMEGHHLLACYPASEATPPKRARSSPRSGRSRAGSRNRNVRST